MAAIKCPSCGAYVSVSGAVSCPKCQSSLPIAVTAVEKNSVNNSSVVLNSSSNLFKEIFSGLLLLALGVLVFFIIWKLLVPSEEKKHKRQVSDALLGCQYAIKSLAKFGDAETPPYVQNFGKEGEFYFAWPIGSFHFVNGFGVKEKMSASCIGNLDTGKITRITLNGKDVQ